MVFCLGVDSLHCDSVLASLLISSLDHLCKGPSRPVSLGPPRPLKLLADNMRDSTYMYYI